MSLNPLRSTVWKGTISLHKCVVMALVMSFHRLLFLSYGILLEKASAMEGCCWVAGETFLFPRVGRWLSRAQPLALCILEHMLWLQMGKQIARVTFVGGHSYSTHLANNFFLLHIRLFKAKPCPNHWRGTVFFLPAPPSPLSLCLQPFSLWGRCDDVIDGRTVLRKSLLWAKFSTVYRKYRVYHAALWWSS